jgi:hypothetical protein
MQRTIAFWLKSAVVALETRIRHFRRFSHSLAGICFGRTTTTKPISTSWNLRELQYVGDIVSCSRGRCEISTLKIGNYGDEKNPEVKNNGDTEPLSPEGKQ